MTLTDPFALLLSDHLSEPHRLPTDTLIWVHRGERIAPQGHLHTEREAREHQVRAVQTLTERLTR